MRLLGAVLAGGRSSRFGSDKAEALMPDGRTLIEHAVAAMAPHVEAVVVCGRTLEGLIGLADRPAPDLGPLGGLNAALHHARNEGYDAVLTTGCDMPFYPATLAEAFAGTGAAALKDQPLAGYWPVTLGDELEAHLAEENNRSIRGWLERVGGRTVDRTDIVLPNVNRPEDLEAYTLASPGSD